MHAISIEYYQGGGGQAMYAQYSTDNNNWITIPNTMLATGSPIANFGNNVVVAQNGQVTLGDPTIAAAGLTINMGSLTNQGYALQVSGQGNTMAINGAATWSAGSSFNVDSGNTLSLLGPISGAGGLVKNGLGTMAIGTAATYSGDTNINAGTLQLLAAGQLPAASNVLMAPSSTLDVNGAQGVRSVTPAVPPHVILEAGSNLASSATGPRRSSARFPGRAP